VRQVGDIRLAGISGIWAKSHRLPHYVTDEDVARFANEIQRHGDIDIMLTHGCPVGLADVTPAGRRGGQRCFLEAFHTVHPRLYMCGHLHVAQQRILKDGRTVVNVGYTFEGDYWIIEIDRMHIRLEHRNTTSGQVQQSPI
ncbi:MAG: metallophosphoesterase family protein, partial [Armatimonadota bacterium]